MQFVMVPDSTVDEIKDVAEAYVYSCLVDRMKSSRVRREFYDGKLNDYFVVYPLDEMAGKIYKSKRTVSKIYNHLKELGLVIIKRQFNGANKIFLPHSTHKSEKAATPKVKKLQVNHSNLNQYMNDNTVNTSKHACVEFKSEDNATKWLKSTSRIGLTMPTLVSIQKFCKGNIEQCKKVVRIILNARNSTAIKAKIAKSEVTQFESNKNLQSGLNEQLNHIFTYIHSNGYTTYWGYLTNALRDYFKDAFGLKQPVRVVKPKRQQVKFNRKPVIKETLPDWAKDGYQPHYEKAPLADRQRVQAKLEALNKLTKNN